MQQKATISGLYGCIRQFLSNKFRIQVKTQAAQTPNQSFRSSHSIEAPCLGVSLSFFGSFLSKRKSARRFRRGIKQQPSDRKPSGSGTPRAASPTGFVRRGAAPHRDIPISYHICAQGRVCALKSFHCVFTTYFISARSRPAKLTAMPSKTNFFLQVNDSVIYLQIASTSAMI